MVDGKVKIGLEIHQQLDTPKLFCNCPSLLTDNVTRSFTRRLHPTQSELGEVDKAAMEEALHHREITYHAPETVCLVEADEEPPHEINQEAVDLALQVALLLNASVVDEIHLMRKIVIDGSNTSGFQRTGLVAIDGSLKTERGIIRIPTICLEEEAARKTEPNVYNLDRLGIPLVEIATSPDIVSGEETKDVAHQIGQLLRAVKVRRGIGTIRQDINVSVPGGGRVEIKGAQDLRLIPVIVEKEAMRQQRLLEIQKELVKRGVSSAGIRRTAVKDVTPLLSHPGPPKKVLAASLPGFEGLLGVEIQPGRCLATELEGRARIAMGEATSLMHSDDLPKGIADAVQSIRKALHCGAKDGIILIAGKNATTGLKAAIERSAEAVEGMPSETRKVSPDGGTEYMRPLPGPARMYPETDIPPIPVGKERIDRIRAQLPELPQKKKERMMRGYGLSEGQITQLMGKGLAESFERLVKGHGMSSVVARTLLHTLPELKDQGIDPSRITEDVLDDLFSSLASGGWAKEAITRVLSCMVEHGVGADGAISQLDIRPLSANEVGAIIDEILKEHEDLVRKKAAGPLMGLIMEKVRGRADGRVVSETLREKLSATTTKNSDFA